jgi:hypothetical protein
MLHPGGKATRKAIKVGKTDAGAHMTKGRLFVEPARQLLHHI